MTQYAIETERVSPLRWIWAISIPDPHGPSLLKVGYEGSFHPYQGIAVVIGGGDDETWFKREKYGWAFTERGAKRRAWRAIGRRTAKDARKAGNVLHRTVEVVGSA